MSLVCGEAGAGVATAGLEEFEGAVFEFVFGAVGGDECLFVEVVSDAGLFVGEVLVAVVGGPLLEGEPVTLLFAF